MPCSGGYGIHTDGKSDFLTTSFDDAHVQAGQGTVAET